jgi:uncharacterized protein YciI
MLYAIVRLDKPNSLGLRMSERPKHLEYLKSVLEKIVYGGPLLDDGGMQIGSMLIIDVVDQAEADSFANNDPFVDVGLFAQTLVHAFRPLFKEGAWL